MIEFPQKSQVKVEIPVDLPESPEPIQCPFCGNEQFIALNYLIPGYRVACLACMAMGPFCETKEDAVAAWNKRPGEEALHEIAKNTLTINQELEKAINDLFLWASGSNVHPYNTVAKWAMDILEKQGIKPQEKASGGPA